MLFIEFDWSFEVYRFRIGADNFTDFRGWRSFPSLRDWRDALRPHGLKIGRKTDTRTWEVIQVSANAETLDFTEIEPS